MSKIFCVAVVLAALCGTCLSQVPRSRHVVVLTLENHSYEQVIGNPDMPYYNQLASQSFPRSTPSPNTTPSPAARSPTPPLPFRVVRSPPL
jgi:hypothetical protein